MEKRQRHFVLVHGASHGAWCWYKVVAILKSHGHRVTALDMAASGIHHKRVDEIKSESDYHEPLLEFMASLPEHERVILVGHSYGGICISVAMQRFPDKISAAVFAAATSPGPALSFSAVREEYGRRIDNRDFIYAFEDGADKPPTSIVLGPNCLATRLYQLSPIEDLTLGMMLVRPHRLYSSESVDKETVLTKEKYGSVSRIYVVCEEDKIMVEDLQRWMIQHNPPDEVMVISGSDHMVMFSKPQELCSCLMEIAAKYL